MKFFSLFLFLAILPWSLAAQRISIGVQGGVPAETPLGRNNSKMPFALGPTVNVRIVPRLSLDSGILFHRLGERLDTFAFPFPQNSFSIGGETSKGRAIEIPLLLRYTLLSDSRTWQPFITAGPTIRRTSVDFERWTSVVSPEPIPQTGPVPVLKSESVKWNVDPAAGVGVSFRSGRLRIEPQVRYSYWGAGSNSVVRKNQVHFLFGLRF